VTNVLLVGTLLVSFVLVIAVGRMWSKIHDLSLVTSYMFLYLDTKDENFTSFTQEKEPNDD